MKCHPGQQHSRRETQRALVRTDQARRQEFGHSAQTCFDFGCRIKGLRVAGQASRIVGCRRHPGVADRNAMQAGMLLGFLTAANNNCDI